MGNAVRIFNLLSQNLVFLPVTMVQLYIICAQLKFLQDLGGDGWGEEEWVTDTVDKVQYIVSHCSVDNGSQDLNYFVLVSA